MISLSPYPSLYFSSTQPDSTKATGNEEPNKTDNVKPVELTADNFGETVLQSDKPVIVNFWEPWCGDCIATNDGYDELATRMGDKALVAKMNTEDFPDMRKRFDIKRIPTFVIFNNGKEVKRLATNETVDSLENALQPYIDTNT